MIEKMIEELASKYINDFFIFRPSDSLSYVCNAPSFASGFYVIYAFLNGRHNLVYIGISGLENKNGVFKHRKDGIRGRFLAGKQFGERRQVSWSKKMETESIEHLKIRWFITYDDLKKDIPRYIELELLKKHIELNGQLPSWNNKL